MNKLYISSSPHIYSKASVSKIMWVVSAVLLPAGIWGIYKFGFDAFITILVSITTCMFTEFVFSKMFKKRIKVDDGSAFLTGLLLAYTLPPKTPVLVIIAGGIFAIGIGKMVFGGLGYNIFNPALIGRAFLTASWPVYLTTWQRPVQALNPTGFTQKILDMLFNRGLTPEIVDSITSATPLGAFKMTVLDKEFAFADTLRECFYDPSVIRNLFFGNIGGTIGEISALLLLIGGAFLIIKKIISWHIPVVYILTVGVLGHLFGGPGFCNGNFLFSIFSGGLMLGAFFMATDYVTSPIYAKGKLIFAFFAGFLVFIIRRFGGYPEGVLFSILIMNAFVPLIDKFTKPKVFGQLKEIKK